MYVVKRSKSNPILTPSMVGAWGKKGVFNASPIKRGKNRYLVYRAQSGPDPLFAPDGLSTLAISKKISNKFGGTFGEHRRLMVGIEPWERYGCEDPRVTYFEGKYLICYTALGGYPFNAGNIKVAMALSKDLSNIDERHLVTPFNAKAMAIFPERIGGKITAILSVHTDEPPTRMGIVQCDKLEELWDENFWKTWHENIKDNVIDPRRSEQDHVEVGSVPIKTDKGWLLIYSHMHHRFGGGDLVFAVEALLLDLKNPLKVVGHTRGPILVPQESYEIYGLAGKSIFPSGAELVGQRLDIYYSGSDTVMARASLNLRDLLTAMELERPELGVRAKTNPIIIPQGNTWEAKATFNPAALDLAGSVRLFYRAMSSDNTSVFGYAKSKDGEHIDVRLSKPAYVPRADFEQKKGDAHGNSGCEDPRLVVIGKEVVMTYTAYDGVLPPRVALSRINLDDFTHERFDRWSKPFLLTPDGVDDKDACILPEKINGEFMLLHRLGHQVCADFFPRLEEGLTAKRCIEILSPRPGGWDSERVGLAGVPIKTKYGWLAIYHGISKTMTYRLGAALLDLDDPTRLVARTVDPILEPKDKYEKEGQVHNVIFSAGAIVRKDELYIYYGGADKVSALARVPMKRLLEILCPKNLAD